MSVRYKIVISFYFLLSLNPAISQSSTKIIVNADIEKSVINKHIYGHFAEHLGRCIYDGIYVGDNKEIPTENGVRKDIITALRDLKVPNLRWPGGCFADTYQWKDGIGPKAKRPKIVNIWWGGHVEDNSFGTHEFLDLCEKIGAEPYLAANVGSGSVKDLMDWVDYTNSSSKSDMVLKRQENGRALPWNVKLWGVGNEAWGCGGNMQADYYANIYRQYATFMADWSNSNKLFRIASGASDGDYSWTESLMKNIPHHMMSGVALHHYSVIDWSNKGPASNFSEYQYFRILEEAWKMDKFIKGHSTIMDKYDPNKQVALIVDEWGGWYDKEAGQSELFQQNTMRDAVIAGLTLNIFNNHAERVRGANLAQIVNVLQSVILTDKEKMILTPTYHVMKMYNVHQDATLLDSKILACPQYIYDKKSLDALSVSASKSKGGEVTVSITNIDYKTPQNVTVSLRGRKFSEVNAEILSGKSASDFNSWTETSTIAPKKILNMKLENDIFSITMPPHSVVLITLK
jgi:alpha-L-arabinofuranosidase